MNAALLSFLASLIMVVRASATGPVYEIVEHLHATYFIDIIGVPLLLWTHGILYVLLTRRDDSQRTSKLGTN